MRHFDTKSIIRPLLCAVATGFWAYGLMGCATSNGVAHEYREALRDSDDLESNGHTTLKGPRTSLVIMVDGLGTSTLRAGLRAGQLPEITRFFSAPHGNLRGSEFVLARGSFPTLTYPNLVSLVTGRAVDGHGILGNRLLGDEGEIIDFENVLNWKKLEHKISPMTAFSVLRNRGQASVSYSYPLFNGGTANQRPSFEVAAGYASKDYDVVDIYTLESLGMFLESTPAHRWPRFIFVHLINVDGVEHEKGANTPQVLEALRILDRRLAPIFHWVRKAENEGHHTDTVLTSDHGFVNVSYQIPIEKLVARLPSAKELKLVVDNRVASMYLPSGWSLRTRREAAREFSQISKIGWTALRQRLPADGEGIGRISIFYANGSEARIDFKNAQCDYGPWAARYTYVNKVTTRGQSGFHCPEIYDELSDTDSYTFVVSSLLEYFRAEKSPDLVLVPDDDADFSGAYRGNHGGLTSEEVLVPMLARHARLGRKVFPVHRLLHKLEIFSEEKQ